MYLCWKVWTWMLAVSFWPSARHTLHQFRSLTEKPCWSYVLCMLLSSSSIAKSCRIRRSARTFFYTWLGVLCRVRLLGATPLFVLLQKFMTPNGLIEASTFSSFFDCFRLFLACLRKYQFDREQRIWRFVEPGDIFSWVIDIPGGESIYIVLSESAFRTRGKL